MTSSQMLEAALLEWLILIWIASTFFQSQTALFRVLAHLSMKLEEILLLSMETKLIFHRSTSRHLTIKEQKSFKVSVGLAKIAFSSLTIIMELGVAISLFKWKPCIEVRQSSREKCPRKVGESIVKLQSINLALIPTTVTIPKVMS